MDLLLDILLFGLAVASATMTIAKSNAMEWPRTQVSKLSCWARDLIHCPYCLSHWLSLGLVWWEIGTLPLDRFILTTFGTITVASLASLGIAQLFLALDEFDHQEDDNV